MKSRLLTHLIIFGGVSAFATGSRLALKERHDVERRQIAASASERRSKETQAAWRAFPYTNLPGVVLSARIAAGTNWSSIQLSDTQKQRLRDRLSELFEYLKNPTFDEYYRLRTERLHYRFVPSTNAARNFRFDLSELEKHLAHGERAGVRYFWDSAHAGANTSPVKLTGFFLESFSMAKSTTNSVPHILVGPVSKGFTGASELANPGFDYTAPPTANAGPPQEFVHLSFFARAEDSGNAGPVYVSLQWIREDQQWALSRLITDVWLGVNSLF